MTASDGPPGVTASDGPPPAPALWVAGLDGYGDERVRLRVEHGDDPRSLLAWDGWSPLAPVRVDSRSAPHQLVFGFTVERAARAPTGRRTVPLDPGLVVAPGEVASPYQRLAVYGVVTSTRGVLLTQLSDRTNAAGRWGLPGGGLDPGETAEEGLHREVREETGQRVRVIRFEDVLTQHWVGRAPSGRLEDFHAVRVVYRAVCDDPGDARVLEVDGTTAAAAWVPLADVLRLPLVPTWRGPLAGLAAEPA